MEDPFDPLPEGTLTGSGAGILPVTPARTKQPSSQSRFGGGSARKQGGVCRLFNKAPLAAPMVTSVFLCTDAQFATVPTMARGTVWRKAGAQAHEDTGGTRAEGPST